MTFCTASFLGSFEYTVLFKDLLEGMDGIAFITTAHVHTE